MELIEFGLKEPTLDLVPFFIEVFRLGLRNSNELRKYEAFMLLGHRLGLISDQKLQLLDKFNAENEASIRKIVDAIIPRIAQFYIEQYGQEYNLDPRDYRSINQLMIKIQQDHAVAVSNLHNVPILCAADTIRLWRGASFPRCSKTRKLIDHTLQFGHQAFQLYHEALGFGQEQRKYEEILPVGLIPILSTHTTSSLSIALRYAIGDEYTTSILFCITCPPGHVIPFKLHEVNKAMHADSHFYSVMIMPILAPETLEIYEVEKSLMSDSTPRKVLERFSPKSPDPKTAFLAGETITVEESSLISKPTFLPRMCLVSKEFGNYLYRAIEPLMKNPVGSYAVYLQNFDFRKQLTLFNQQCDDHSIPYPKLQEALKQFGFKTRLLNLVQQYAGTLPTSEMDGDPSIALTFTPMHTITQSPETQQVGPTPLDRAVEPIPIIP